MNKIKVQQAGRLLDILFGELKGYHKTTIRNLLKSKMVWIQGKPVSQFNFEVQPGDVIEIKSRDTAKVHTRTFPFKIIFEDDAMLVVEKPAGLPAIATAKSREHSLYFQVHEYLKLTSPKRQWQGFIVHRLDREVSGLMVFAKTALVKEALQRNWQHFEKYYLGSVEGKPKAAEDTLISYLHENHFLKVYSGPQNKNAKCAVTHYKMKKTNGRVSLLDIRLETGRKHQIRVQLSDIGCPIVGDEKYGAQTKMPKTREGEWKRIALHAYQIVLTHPVTGKKMTFHSRPPQSIYDLVQ